MKSLGLLEVSGVTAAVTALDIMCKTADVEFVTWERKLGGRLVTIIVEGEVAAVRQAVEAAAANGIKKPVNYTVIARPHEEIVRLVEWSILSHKWGSSTQLSCSWPCTLFGWCGS